MEMDYGKWRGNHTSPYGSKEVDIATWSSTLITFATSAGLSRKWRTLTPKSASERSVKLFMNLIPVPLADVVKSNADSLDALAPIVLCLNANCPNALGPNANGPNVLGPNAYGPNADDPNVPIV